MKYHLKKGFSISKQPVFKTTRDTIRNNVIVTDKLITPVTRNLPETGIPGQILYDNASATFYGWNGVEWVSFVGGGGGFEQVTGSVLNPNIETSLIQSGGASSETSVEWGARVSGEDQDISLFFNQAALNNTDESLIGVISVSDPMVIYNGNGSIAFTLPHYGSESLNNIFVKYSSNGTATLVGNIFNIAEDPFTYVYSVDLNDASASVVNGLYTTTLLICDGSNQPISSLEGGGIFLITFSPSNSFDWATHISGDLSVPYPGAHNWNCAMTDKVVVSGGFYGTINIYNSDGTYTNLSSAVDSSFITKYNSTGILEWATKITGENMNSYNVPCDINNNETVVLASYTSSNMVAYNFDGTPTDTLENNGFDALSAVFSYTSSGTLQWSSAIRSNNNAITDIKIIDNGNVFACGEYNNDTLNIYNFNGVLHSSLPSSATNDAFLIKWNSVGETQWAARIAGIDFEGITCIDVNDSGNIVVTGYYESDPLYIFNSLDEIAATLGAGNIFVVTYTNDGDVISASKIDAVVPGPIAFSTGINNLGNIIVAGAFFENLAVFDSTGSIALTLNYTASNGSDFDAFIVKYNSVPVVSLADPIKDGQEKVVTTNVPVILNTVSPIEGNVSSVKLDTYESISLLWDAIESNWIVISTNAQLL